MQFDLSTLQAAVKRMNDEDTWRQFRNDNPYMGGNKFSWALPRLARLAEQIYFPVMVQDPVTIHDSLASDVGGKVFGMCRSETAEFTNGTIYLHPDNTPDENVRVLSHELAHAIIAHGHWEADDEIIAETSAHIVCKNLGLDTWNFTLPYLAYNYYPRAGTFRPSEIHTAVNRIMEAF
jgi:hypothetical protein